MPLALYIASFLGAVSVWMMMPRDKVKLRGLGALLGAATLGGLWLFLSGWVWIDWWPQFQGLWWWLGEEPGVQSTILPYHCIFSFIAIAAAVRVITHTKPVFSAIWFIMVVLASAGLLLVLAAEFMAFAMVIIYGGAIMVTYMFVIMLASHAGDPKHSAEAPEYDRLAREPLVAVAAGFLLLAVLLNIAFPIEGMEPNEGAKGPDDQAIIDNVLTERAARQLAQMFKSTKPADLERAQDAIGADLKKLSNVERVGLDLFRSHPLGLELAGVILLVALIGAVVIARTKVDDQTPTAAGGPAPS